MSRSRRGQGRQPSRGAPGRSAATPRGRTLRPAPVPTLVEGALQLQQAVGNRTSAGLLQRDPPGGATTSERAPAAATDDLHVEGSHEEAVRDRVRAGFDAYVAGDHAEALGLFREAYAIRPLAELQFNLAVCHERLDQPGRALRHYRRYLREEPEAEDAEEVRRRIDRLVAAVEERAAGAPRGAEREAARRRFEEAQRAYQDGDHTTAYRLFRELFTEDPRAAYQYNLALTATRLGRDLAAANHYRHYLDMEPGAADAEEVRARIERLDPEAASPAGRERLRESRSERRRLAVGWLDAGDYERAYRLFADLYAETRDPHLLYDLASCQHRLGNHRRALRHASRAHAVLPDRSTRRLLEELRAEVGSTEDVGGSEELFEEAQRAFHAGELDRSGELMAELYSRHPVPDLLYNLGTVRQAQGRRSDAVRLYSRYLEENEDAEDAEEVRSRVRRLRTELGRSDRRSSAAERRRARDLGRRGWAAFRAGRYGEAAVLFERCFEVLGDPRLLWNLALARHRAGRRPGAVSALRRYLRAGGDRRARARRLIERLGGG